jgi:L-amino acid N-acyltransferase YncA
MEFHIDYSDHELKNGFQFDIKIRNTPKKRVTPIFRLARPEDAKHIVKIVKDDYEGSYPYKEMEDPDEVRRMIESGRYKFVVFLNEQEEIIGNTCFVLNLEEKTGYTRTFVVKKEWLGVLDATKAYVASFVAICNRYKDKIHMWWGEMRTADAKSQYINRLCSFRPLGFLPNKDRFYNQIESDILVASYNKEMFTHHRSSKLPSIIPKVIQSYAYSDLQYHLGNPDIISAELDYSQLKHKASGLQNDLIISNRADKFNYITYRLSLKHSDPSFQFLYTPRVNNFEKVKYKVNSLEELYLFISTFRNIGRELGIRYMESYVSAYQHEHQALFAHLGFTPRGYLPAFRFNSKTGKFEDIVLMNWFRKPLVECELIPEGSLLLKCLNMNSDNLVRN